jgi:hypothetical protein
MLYAIATFLPPSGCHDMLHISIKNAAGCTASKTLPAVQNQKRCRLRCAAPHTSPRHAPLRRARVSEYSQRLGAGRLAAVIEELAIEIILVDVDGGVLSQARVGNVSQTLDRLDEILVLLHLFPASHQTKH